MTSTPLTPDISAFFAKDIDEVGARIGVSFALSGERRFALW